MYKYVRIHAYIRGGFLIPIHVQRPDATHCMVQALGVERERCERVSGGVRGERRGGSGE